MAKYRRPRQAKWDRRHLVTVSTHLTEEQYQRLRALCTLSGDRPYFICRRALMDYIGSSQGTTNADVDLLRSGILEEVEQKDIDGFSLPELPAVTDRRKRLREWRLQ